MLTFRMLVALAILMALHGSALATPHFFEKFEERYGNAAPGFGGLIKQSKCNICHIAGEKKSIRNEYGEALKNAGLDKGLARPAVKNQPATVKAIKDAFDKTDKQKSSQGDTYGERIKAGKLPSP